MQIDLVTGAARAGDAEVVSDWLERGGNPNQYDSFGWTPLLAAAVRGEAEVTRALLAAEPAANPALPFLPTGALPIHLAGQAGSIAVAEQILAARADQLDEVWLLNGHTLLLQAVFFGHVDLTRWALRRGASTAATTARGLAAVELAEQFRNTPLVELLRPHDAPPDAKATHLRILLGRIAAFGTMRGWELQQRQDQLIETVQQALRQDAGQSGGSALALAAVRQILDGPGLDVDALGGPLQQPALVVAVTGNDDGPRGGEVAELRREIVLELLKRGADPTVRERHPMGVDAIIRASVFAHLAILKDFHDAIGPARMKAALNIQPAVNGLTALHDSVLRASTAAPERLELYLEQIRWYVSIGARVDIEDYAGRTQRSIAEGVTDPKRRRLLLQALAPRRR